jgi:cyclic pyranopterin monophosphate synthase
MSKLTHLDDQGRASMVDVSDKDVTERTATAAGSVTMLPETLTLIEQGLAKKGDVLTVAKIAGIQAAKQTASLIPLCHPLNLSAIDVELSVNREASRVDISARCLLNAKTGVEMEALTAVSVAALTVYDMCKAVDRGMVIGEIGLIEKHGGKSGSWIRK